MKNIIIGIFCLLSLQVYSQDKKIIELRKSYRIVNTDSTITLRFPEKKTIKLDTTIVEIDSSQLSFLKDYKLFDDREIFKKYISHTGIYIPDRALKQWIVPIKIYFDSKINSSVINNFKQFILSFNKIDNLKISIVNKLENANYYFKISDNEVIGYNTEELEYFEKDEISNLPFLKTTYNAYGDDNNKLLNCIFKISPSALSELNFLDNLKKGFYYSLTQFSNREDTPEDSLLNINSKDIFVLSEYDFLLLKIHYENLFTFKVDYKTLLELDKIHKSKYN